MGIGKAFLNGTALVLRRPKIVLLLWALNTAIALVAALPFASIVQAELGPSFWGSNIRPLDLPWLSEAALRHGASLPALAAGLAGAAVLTLILQVFLNGGILGRLLEREEKPFLQAFFGDAARYFGRFLRLFALSLVALPLVLWAGLELLRALSARALESAGTEWTVIVLTNLRLLAGLLVLSIVRMAFDYARISIVADGRRRALAALAHAAKFLKKRFFRSWALYLLVTVLSLAGTALFLAVLGALSGPRVAFVVIGAILMQLHVIFRAAMKTLLFASQAEFYKAHPY